MRKISFIPPNTTEDQQKNWMTLINSMEQQEWDPFLGTTMAAQDFTAGTLESSIYYTVGPLVFFSLAFGNVAWDPGANILMPYGRALRPGQVVQYEYFFQAYSYSQPEAADTFTFRDGPSRLEALGGSGGTYGEIGINGWYFRD